MTKENSNKNYCERHKKFQVIHARGRKESDCMGIDESSNEVNVAAVAGALAPKVYRLDQVSIGGRTHTGHNRIVGSLRRAEPTASIQSLMTDQGFSWWTVF